MTRFSLRDVFWLTLVVGLGICLAIDRNNLEFSRRERQAVRLLSNACGTPIQWADDESSVSATLPDGHTMRITIPELTISVEN